MGKKSITRNLKRGQKYNSTVTILIKGNNNNIIIENIFKSNLSVDIGNYTGADNVNIKIGKNIRAVKLNILAHQSNVPITIGDNCLFSKNITIRSGELPHRIFDKDTKTNLDNSKGIIIGNHVWIGENSYILKRAAIPNNSIVGSASVVTKKFDEDNIVIAGNPAKICRKNIMWEIE